MLRAGRTNAFRYARGLGGLKSSTSSAAAWTARGAREPLRTSILDGPDPDVKAIYSVRWSACCECCDGAIKNASLSRRSLSASIFCCGEEDAIAKGEEDASARQFPKKMSEPGLDGCQKRSRASRSTSSSIRGAVLAHEGQHDNFKPPPPPPGGRSHALCRLLSSAPTGQQRIAAAPSAWPPIGGGARRLRARGSKLGARHGHRGRLLGRAARARAG